MGLPLNAPALNRNDDSLTLSQERDMAIQQGTANLEPTNRQADQMFDGALRCLPEDVQANIKKEISEFAYREGGSFADIQSMRYAPSANAVTATVNYTHTITLKFR